MDSLKRLYPNRNFLWEGNDDTSLKTKLLSKFSIIRPVLETGWEASLMIKYLHDGLDDGIDDKSTTISDEILTERATYIINNWQHWEGNNGNENKNDTDNLKQYMLYKLNLTKDKCNVALKESRNYLIENKFDEWLNSHTFYHGAVEAVRNMLNSNSASGATKKRKHSNDDTDNGNTTNGNENVYVITTKAKEFALKLLEQQALVSTTESKNNNNNKIPISNVYGLGSGPKEQVLATLIESKIKELQQSQNDIMDNHVVIAVMVEDNVATLNRIMLSSNDLFANIMEKQSSSLSSSAVVVQVVPVLPVVASWGYITKEQLDVAKLNKYVILDSSNPSSISNVLYNNEQQVMSLYNEYNKNK